MKANIKLPRHLLLLLIISLSVLTMISCTKRDLKNKKKDLSRSWVVKEVYKNERLDTLTGAGWIYNFYESGAITLNYFDNDTAKSISGDWQLMYSGTVVKMHFSGTFKGNPYNDNIYWEILKLDKNNFWAYYNEGTNKYEYRLIPYIASH